MVSTALSQLHLPFLVSHRNSVTALEERDSDVHPEEQGGGEVEERLRTLFPWLDVDSNSQFPTKA